MINLKRILAPTDFSQHSNGGVGMACELASRFNAELELLHVAQNPYYFEGGSYEAYTIIEPEMREAAKQQLAVLPGAAWEAKLNVSRHVRFGAPFLEIVSHAKLNDIDLIVQNTHGRTGVAHFFIGSVAEKVVRKAPCPVLTVRGTGGGDVPKRILAATDFGQHSENALNYAVEFANRFGAELHVLHVVSDPAVSHPEIGLSMLPLSEFREEIEAGGQRQLDEVNVSESHPDVLVRKVLRMGSTLAGIVDYAKEADIDLIVLGTHGRNALSQVLIGSVAEKVVRHAPCSVLSVHHPEHEFISPMQLEEHAEIA
ncbi:MAG: universal stress protein [Planctomycetota bacterium]|nr:universal stress protein [Planctomycetota bacterium]